MVENSDRSGVGTVGAEDEVSAFDAASYAHQMTAELARLAREGGLTMLADSLDLSHDLAAAAMVDLRRRYTKPAPDDAA